MNKKATISVSFLIGMVILVLSAAAIFYLLYIYDWGKTSRIDACHQQILYRHTFNIGAEETGKRTIPLTACRAGHVCFVTSKNEDCPELKGLEDIEKVKIETKEEIIKELAERMRLCWSMVGEGYLDYQPSKILSKTYCAICDKIAFSDEVRTEIEEINYGELYNYLESTNIEGLDKTYSQYLYNLNSMEPMEKDATDKYKEKTGESVDIRNLAVVDTKKEHVIITAITKAGWARELMPFVSPAATIITTLFTDDSLGREEVVQVPPQILVYENDEIVNEWECDVPSFLP